MFGHDNQSQHDAASQPAQDSALTHDDQALADASNASDTAGQYMEDDAVTGAPSTPVTDDEPTAAPAVSLPSPTASMSSPAVTSTPSTDVDNDSLLGIKQQALQQLTPLVGHLEQSAEEKFRTTMMMIQASDNPSLVKTAYDAALQITDEKVRAQALLDIVNEINYFTHNGESSSAES